MKKLTLALMISGVLAGCASFPDDYKKPVGAQDVRAQKADEWSKIPAITFVQSNAGVPIRKYDDVPAAVRAKKIDIKFDRIAQPTLSDVVFALGQQGFRLVSRLGDDTMKKPWTIQGNESNVGDVLDDIGATYNIAFEFHNGSVYLLESNKFSASLPQHKEFMDGVAKALKDMGATDIRADILSGLVYYSAKPEQAEYIADYLNTIAKNAAMVTLQVAVLTVSSNRGLNQGFDWSQFSIGTGHGGLRNNMSSLLGSGSGTNGTSGGGVSQPSSSSTTNGGVTSTNNSTTTGSTSTTSGSSSSVSDAVGTVAGSVASTATQLVTGSLLSFTGSSGLGYQLSTNSFSLSAAISALSTYGTARTEQNVIMGTLSGMPVKINSGDDIPYVKSIGAATAAGGATTGSSQTDTIKSGLKLDVTPSFDAADGTVITTVKVDMSALVGWVQLSAGQNLGTLSQPQMKNLGFENVGRLEAGDTLILGGVTYDQSSDNYTNVPGLESMPLGSKNTTSTKTAMYIVVRPTVVMFTPKANELNAKLALIQAQEKADQQMADEAAKAGGKPGAAVKGDH